MERAGATVSKEELIARTWPDTHVAEANLRVHVAALRKALRDGHDGQRYITNIPLHGYSFVAPVEMTAPHGVSAASGARPPTTNYLPPPKLRLIGRDAAVEELAVQIPKRRFVSA